LIPAAAYDEIAAVLVSEAARLEREAEDHDDREASA
jgi:hypothetical protein